jgi:hypothetical protein
MSPNLAVHEYGEPEHTARTTLETWSPMDAPGHLQAQPAERQRIGGQAMLERMGVFV